MLALMWEKMDHSMNALSLFIFYSWKIAGTLRLINQENNRDYNVVANRNIKGRYHSFIFNSVVLLKVFKHCRYFTFRTK